MNVMRLAVRRGWNMMIALALSFECMQKCLAEIDIGSKCVDVWRAANYIIIVILFSNSFDVLPDSKMKPTTSRVLRNIQ